MPDTTNPMLIAMLAEYAKQVPLVCGIFAGVALAMVFVEGGRRRGSRARARDRVIRSLTAAAVAMITAICTAALFLFTYGAVQAGIPEAVEAHRAATPLAPGIGLALTGIWLVSLFSSVLGVVGLMSAVYASGSLRSPAEGRRSALCVSTGGAAIGVCFILLVVAILI